MGHLKRWWGHWISYLLWSNSFELFSLSVGGGVIFLVSLRPHGAQTPKSQLAKFPLFEIVELVTICAIVVFTKLNGARLFGLNKIISMKFMSHLRQELCFR